MKLKEKLIHSIVIAFQTVFITGITIFSVSAPFSCKISEEGIKLVKGDYESPVIQNFLVKDERTLFLTFSEKVKLNGCSVSPLSKTSDFFEGAESLSVKNIPENEVIQVTCQEMENVVQINLDRATVLGKEYQLYGNVVDAYGNSLAFSIPFTGFNSRVPKIIMTEIQTASVGSQNTKEKSEGTYRNEFVEFLALSDGNLSGVQLLSGYDGPEKAYNFPAVEVKKGELFVVHLRKRGNGCISEEGDNLNLAYASYTNPGIRDLWGTEEGTLLGNKTDVILVKNSNEGTVLDAAMFREAAVDSWTRDMGSYAAEIFESGIYSSEGVEAASITDGLTDTKTLHRKDAAELYREVAGGGGVEYPVKADSSTWIVTTVSAGAL